MAETNKLRESAGKMDPNLKRHVVFYIAQFEALAQSLRDGIDPELIAQRVEREAEEMKFMLGEGPATAIVMGGNEEKDGQAA